VSSEDVDLCAHFALATRSDAATDWHTASRRSRCTCGPRRLHSSAETSCPTAAVRFRPHRPRGHRSRA
jgi:hypothetical protein